MKKIISYLIFISVLCLNNTFAQKQIKNNFNLVIREEMGDLNNDQIPDIVTIQMDTTDASSPMQLNIFLSQAKGKLLLALSSDKIIEPQYPIEKNGKYNGFQIPYFYVEDGLLKMWRQINHGNISLSFKYQNKNFELIEITKISYKPNNGQIDENTVFTEITFDLISGEKVETTDNPTKGLLNKKQQKILIRPLPKLKNLSYTNIEAF